jgi:hypothetical protein
METLLLILGVGVGVSLIAVASMRERYATLWRSSGPARAVALSKGDWKRARTSEGIPLWVQLTAVSSIVLGLLTGFVFSPGGMLALLLLVDQAPTAAVLVFLVSLHGFVMAGRLCSAAGKAMRGDAHGLLRVALASICHHILVVIAFLPTYGPGNDFLTLAVPPCAFGVLHGFALLLVARTASKIQAEPTSD